MVRWQQIKEKWRKDGWLLMALAAAVILCLTLNGIESLPAGQTEEEARLARVLSAMEGAGNVEVAVFYEPVQEKDASSRPCGVVVVAQGADDITVRLRLTRAVCTLLGVDSEQVEVFPSEGGAT